MTAHPARSCRTDCFGRRSGRDSPWGTNQCGGAGSALLLGVAGALVAVCLLVLPLGAGLAARHRAVAAADAAALAAGDIALGAAPGVPCDGAREVAEANGARLVDCVQRGLVVRVRVAADAAGLPVEAVARAGPQPGGTP